MGCGISSQNNMIKDRMIEFQIRNPSKEIEINSQRQILNQPHYKIGDYFTIDISNKEFKYFESRFTQLIQEELKKKKIVINWESPEGFIISLMENHKIRKDVFDIIKRKGFDHPYRWICYRLFSQASDFNFLLDKQLEETRRELYPLLIKCKNESVEDIVNKDVMRTARHKELFSNLDAVGSQLLYDNCKAIGCFFPKTGYVQGMNFIMGFLLEISGMEEFETFNFILNFFKKRKNLYFGLYEDGLPLVHFLKFSFHKLLIKENPKISQAIKQMDLPDELWITKWIISFFSFSVTKDFLIRIFDFLMVVDMFGLVYIALILTEQLKPLFLQKDLGGFAQVVGNPEQFCASLNYQKFVKKLKKIEVSPEIRLALLEEYYVSLSDTQKPLFHYYYQITRQRLSVGFKENYDEWEHVNDYQDMDNE